MREQMSRRAPFRVNQEEDRIYRIWSRVDRIWDIRTRIFRFVLLEGYW